MALKTVWLFAVAAALSACALPAAPLAQESPASTPLVARDLLEAVGLTAQWQLRLPVKPDEKLDRLFVFDAYLYAITDRNYLFCIDRQEGRVRFGIALAKAGLPVCDPALYDGKLWLLVGNSLLVLDPLAGRIEQSRRLPRLGPSAVCSFARNADSLYVPGSDGRVHVLAADEYYQRFSVTPDDDSLVTSVLVDEALLWFTTEAGSVVCVDASGPQKKWQYDMLGGISAPLVRDGAWVYASCEDTKLYKLDAETGQNGWKADFQAGAPLKTSAVAGKRLVYQYAGAKGLYAVDKESGRAVWNLPRGVGVLTEAGSRAFVYELPGMLNVMDNSTGKSACTVNLAAVTRYASFLGEPTMYVADETGRVVNIVVPEAK